MRIGRPIVLLALLHAVPAFAQHQHGAPPPDTSRPPLYTDLGTWHHAVTTASKDAQAYFDQGLRLVYGFNHEEAARAFRAAAEIDAKCAMAWWGVAYAAGPNINLPMDDEHARIANDAILRARTLRDGASGLDRDYIDALSTRYSTNPDASRAGLDSTYANAMRGLAQRHPEDPDAVVLFAESLLDLNPWNQWTHDGQPNPGTLEILSTLEGILKTHPEHPGANHYYIHAVEASPDPKRALVAAERLKTLVPGAGHLVHMPSHIYARTGQYDEALRLNQHAALVDEKYIAAQKPDGAYPLMYYNHNLQFIWFAASMEGRSAEALQAARKIVGNVPPAAVAQMPMLQMAPPWPIQTLARFGRWDEVLREPAPDSQWRYSTAMWHYARGLAYAAKGQSKDAQAALDSVRAAETQVPPDLVISINPARPLIRVAAQCLAGRIAAQAGDRAAAVKWLEGAVATEDSLHYDEPPTWYGPPREMLGAVLLDAGRAADAEAVYREDLKRHPDNGWSLFGLTKALRAQNRAKEASECDARFQKAWKRADVKLAASTF